MSASCIDHCYTNSPQKVSEPELLAVGTSDHLGLVVRKFSKNVKSKPNTVKKRSYKDFIIEDFLTDVMESEINQAVTNCKDIDEAALEFETRFKKILDFHAPVKVFQMRRNYNRYLSEETKLLIDERKVMKEEMTKHGDKQLGKEIKIKSKEILKAIQKDEMEYFEAGLSDEVDVNTAWKTANELLGNKKNLAPTAIEDIGKDGVKETITNPQRLANIFNQFFRKRSNS